MDIMLQSQSMPWNVLHAHRPFTAWVATLLQSIIHPCRHATQMPWSGSISIALYYAVITIASITGGSLIISWFATAFFALAFAGPAGVVAEFASLPIRVATLAIKSILCAGTLAYGLYFLCASLRVQVLQMRDITLAVCYNTGAVIAIDIPVIGGMLASLWILVASGIALQSRYSSNRRRVAAATWILCPITIIVNVYLDRWIPMPTRIGAEAVAKPAIIDAGLMSQYIQSYAVRHGGNLPKHISELILPPTYFPAMRFCSLDSHTLVDAVWIDGRRWSEVIGQPVETQQSVIGAFAQSFSSPTDVYRFGDYVVTLRNVPITSVNADVWMALLFPDPRFNQSSPSDLIVAIRADGQLKSIRKHELALALEAQNEVRRKSGLPPILDLDSVQ